MLASLFKGVFVGMKIYEIFGKHPSPTFSIVTIVRNGRQFIEQTIQSVIGQSYPDIQYIVIDGGSTDGTVDVIKAYESSLGKWISEKDGGIADAFNKGLSFAAGDYVLFLNSDDALADRDVIADIAEKIVENDWPALIYGDFDLLNRDSGDVAYRGKVTLTPRGMLRGQVLPHPCLFTHREYFEKYGDFDTSFKIAMDYEWMLRGGMIEKIVHVSRLISNIRDGGISTQNQGEVVKEIVRALQKNGHFSSMWGGFALRSYFWTRAMSRILLTKLGLYKLFFITRNKLNNG